MPCPSIVRTAKPEDLQEIWRLFLMSHKEQGMFPLAVEKVNWFLDRALYPERLHQQDTGPRGVVAVIGEVGSLEGLAFVTIGEMWFSYAKHLEEFTVYVDPEHRRSNHAKALLNWMKHEVDVTGVPLITGIISNERTEAKCRLYGRVFQKVGEFYTYFGHKGSGMPLTVTASS